MKYVIISRYWKDTSGGGIATYLLKLENEFRCRQIDTKVIFKQGVDKNNYKVSGNKIMFVLKSYFLLNKIKPDAIYSQNTWYCLLPGYLYKKTHVCKLIHTFHTEPNASDKLNFFSLFFLQYLCDGCDHVTFVSKKLKQKVQDILGLDFKNAVITYAGVDLPPTVKDTEIENVCNKYGIKKNSIILLALGLTELKYKADGAKLLIEAVKKLGNKYPNLVLILTRDGKYSEELKLFATSECVEDKIIFTGYIEDTNIFLKLCDIYTHTPYGEGLPLAVLEAMAMGKPIIATPAGGIPEAIDDGVNGFIVQPEVDDIVEKIIYLLENKDVGLSAGRKARETVCKKFSWKDSADKFIGLSIN